MSRILKGITVSVLAALLCAVMGFSWHPDEVPAGNAAQDDKLVVIVNNQLDVDSISVADLNRIYLGKKKILAGQNINRLASLENGEIHQLFLSTCLNRSHSSFINYWKRMVFTGKGLMPKVFKNEREIVDYVKKHKTAIGYISVNTPHDGVKSVILKD